MLICAVLLLAILIPLEKFRERRAKIKKSSRLAWFSDLRKELEETRNIGQLGEQALRRNVRNSWRDRRVCLSPIR